jgi:hypothetical protein
MVFIFEGGDPPIITMSRPTTRNTHEALPLAFSSGLTGNVPVAYPQSASEFEPHNEPMWDPSGERELDNE